jgi:citrate synthase
MAMTTAETRPKIEKAPDSRGLAGQTVGDTSICAVTQTELIYRGYEIADLAANATFEEVAFLLLVGHKPSERELKDFKAELASMRGVDSGILEVIAKIAKSRSNEPDVHPMSILRTGVSLLSHVDPDVDDNSPEAELRKAKRLLAQIPTIIGHGQMSRDGKTPVRLPAE